ncbi:hypothetical protein METBIDRAFT_12601 [Metschnikowia bicuspidata var. bicuspidata NRRL YB-4993]|uniref:Uncharacterized protein n=1 Tax=Metschnikowia bicuspidata var. bicuspidata NRRL YB-4993 TaxID=869754 RepID=A0A1A0H9G2_9ASCO|nr:hypothetical protein METBIDRAFT_12601 [Metschnikowia bicuspidata var. bicuspidata NRRL YB-4993]OBA20630.1 hypothetical protein METBIDRAFT_12601 [Metschnikowia bicuspidata var. bicuspidata NRRL YB-4993]
MRFSSTRRSVRKTHKNPGESDSKFGSATSRPRENARRLPMLIRRRQRYTQQRSNCTALRLGKKSQIIAESLTELSTSLSQEADMAPVSKALDAIETVSGKQISLCASIPEIENRGVYRLPIQNKDWSLPLIEGPDPDLEVPVCQFLWEDSNMTGNGASQIGYPEPSPLISEEERLELLIESPEDVGEKNGKKSLENVGKETLENAAQDLGQTSDGESVHALTKNGTSTLLSDSNEETCFGSGPSAKGPKKNTRILSGLRTDSVASSPASALEVSTPGSTNGPRNKKKMDLAGSESRSSHALDPELEATIRNAPYSADETDTFATTHLNYEETSLYKLDCREAEIYYSLCPNSAESLDLCDETDEGDEANDCDLYYMSSNDDSSFSDWKRPTPNVSVVQPIPLAVNNLSHIRMLGISELGRASYIADYEETYNANRCYSNNEASPNYVLDKDKKAGDRNRSGLPVNGNDLWRDWRKPRSFGGLSLATNALNFCWLLGNSGNGRPASVNEDQAAHEASEEEIHSPLLDDQYTNKNTGLLVTPGTLKKIYSWGSAEARKSILNKQGTSLRTEGVQDAGGSSSSAIEKEAGIWKKSFANAAKASGISVPTAVPKVPVVDVPKVLAVQTKPLDSPGSVLAEERASLWDALGLGKITQCQTFKREYLVGRDFSLFRTTRIHLRNLFIFHELVPSLANYVQPEPSQEPKGRTEVKFDDDDVPLEAPQSKDEQGIDRRGFQTRTQSILKATKKPGDPKALLIREFKQPYSARKRKAIDRKMWAKVMLCQLKLEELKRDPKPGSHRQTVGAFRLCFDFTRTNYVYLATEQILEYVCCLWTVKKEAFAVFDNLMGAGYEYGVFLDFASSTRESAETLQQAQALVRLVMQTVRNSAIVLDGLRHQIQHLQSGAPGYIGTMVDLAQIAVSSRTEALEIFGEFWRDRNGADDGAQLLQQTHFDMLIQELDFLADRMKLFQVDQFEKAIEDVARSQELIGRIQLSLESHIGLVQDIIGERLNRVAAGSPLAS